MPECAPCRDRRRRRSAKRLTKKFNPVEDIILSTRNDLNDQFVLVAIGAGVVGGVLTGSVAVGMFVALGISAVYVYNGLIRF